MMPAAPPPSGRRAVVVLCVTQILGWGFLFYPPALTMSYIADERGWSLAMSLSGFSLAMAVSGLMAPWSCGLIDRHGGRLVMAGGSLCGAAGLVLIPFATHFAVYLTAWLLIGFAMSSVLYDPAFATLTRVYGAVARRPITIVTFAGGLASTFAWPTTLLLIQTFGWKGAYLAFAAVLAFIAAPLHAFLLPGPREIAPPAAPVAASTSPVVLQKPEGKVFILIAIGFAAHAFVLSGMSAHLLPICSGVA